MMHVDGIPVPKPVHVHKERKPLRPVNRKRAAKKYERNYGERGHAVRMMTCLLRGRPGLSCAGEIHAAHASARGMGGAKGDRRQLVPLCMHHHSVSHTLAPADLADFFGIDLHAEAARIALELDARGLP